MTEIESYVKKQASKIIVDPIHRKQDLANEIVRLCTMVLSRRYDPEFSMYNLSPEGDEMIGDIGENYELVYHPYPVEELIIHRRVLGETVSTTGGHPSDNSQN